MHTSKAKEIYNSLGVCDVEYKGNKVWINQIIDNEDKAIVKLLGANTLISVNINELDEKY